MIQCETKILQSQTNVPVELAFRAERSYRDIFDEVELDVVFVGPDGELWKVPAFWSGENAFRARFAAPGPGRYTYRTFCSNPDDSGLHGQIGELEAVFYEGDNLLYRRGRLRVASSGRYFEHADGTPFFWLADTWWMGLCKRLSWPSDFQTLTADRVAKGFTAIQIVAGLYPDMPAFDQRGANEAGFPWEDNFDCINPAYFDMADQRIKWIADSGLAPCIVGSWGYFLPWMGVGKVKKHWRNLVARYGAYPVVWCLAGEGAMPYYLSENKDADAQMQKAGWTEVGAYVRELDPYSNPVTIHPSNMGASRDQVEDGSVIDFDMLQTGHGDRQCIPDTIRAVTKMYNRNTCMPVINSEVCYEGIGECCRQEVQRFMFWACVLSGACGHTYGANGIWQVNTRERPYGPSPHGMSWGDTPWEDAYRLPGSAHVALGKRLLERYQWWRFEPHPDWVDPHSGEQGYSYPYAAGIPEEVRVVFLPWWQGRVVLKNVEPDVAYHAFFFDPTNGKHRELGAVVPDQNGEWVLPQLPIFQDWVLVLERAL